MNEDVTDEFEELLKRHSGELDADDLRTLAAKLSERADKWDALEF